MKPDCSSGLVWIVANSLIISLGFCDTSEFVLFFAGCQAAPRFRFHPGHAEDEDKGFLWRLENADSVSTCSFCQTTHPASR